MIVIATKNEEGTIWPLLNKLKKFDVLLVDDSTDATKMIAHRFDNVQIIKGTDEGIAKAYLTGLTMARNSGAKRVIQMDAGGTHNPYDIPALLGKDADLVIGARRFRSHGFRTWISKTAAFLMRVPDATCGFRCWDTALLKQIDFKKISSKGFAFQLEMLKQAKDLGAKIDFAPIEYKLTNSSFRVWMILEAMKVYVQKGMFL